MSAAQQTSSSGDGPVAAEPTTPPPDNNNDSRPSSSSKSKKGDNLVVPSPEELRRIAERQEAKAEEIRRQRTRSRQGDVAAEEEATTQHRDDAAKLIQKNYRGYRARRALRGHGLDPSTRWMEALKEAKYHTNTQPMSRDERLGRTTTADAHARDRWKRAHAIAHHAGSDDTSASETEGDDEKRRRLQRKKTEKAEREKYAKVMGLDYFLEMVDHKHRYGSNLRRYHVEWKKADTNENFFYWLDYGEGKDLDLEDRPRKRLDTEQVRYLSREERQRYLVHIKDGLICFDKNGLPVTTSADFRDSINGIVPVDDETPTWREVTTGEKPEPSPPGSDSDSVSGMSTGKAEDEAKYVNTSLHDAKGLSKLNHVSVDAVMNHMLRKTTKKNTWIFVADTSFRLYIGIKQSGAFQHSSFLRGARVAAAGLIKVKHGQLRKLSPLSGHYSPPLRNFREFVASLKEAGADLSHVSLSRSYSVLLGLEGYLGAKRTAKSAQQGVKDLVNPDSKREREEAAMDTSRSAQREREVLEAQEREKRKGSLSSQLLRKMRLRDGDDKQDGAGGENRKETKDDRRPVTPSSPPVASRDFTRSPESMNG